MRKNKLRSLQRISLIKMIINLFSIWPFSPLPILKLHCSFCPQSIILLEKSKLSKWECFLTARRGWAFEQCPGWMHVREKCGSRISTLYMPESARKNQVHSRGPVMHFYRSARWDKKKLQTTLYFAQNKRIRLKLKYKYLILRYYVWGTL